MNRKYIVQLSDEERAQLQQMIASGTASARKIRRAQILLKSDSSPKGPNWSYQAICEAFDVSETTITTVRKAYCEGGLEAALNRKPSVREYRRRLDGEAEAHLIALACSQPPEGHVRWTLRLLRDRFVEAGYAEPVSHETIRQVLKNELKPWLKQRYCIPPHENAAFVCQMEEVLEVYQRPYDPRRPMVCMDELPQQLLVNVREPLPIKPGCPLREDYEYERKGVSNLFLFFEPLAGKRHVQVSERRTKVDWAHAMRHLADELYPEADVIVVVMDNLNTHSPASFYEAFEPAEAQRLRARFEFHYTPKHGSWLNMAEIELSALVRSCLNRRIPDQATLHREVQAWVEERNQKAVRVDWRFTTANARMKLKHLYPKIHA
jgi:hypothetical protein